MTVLVTGGTGSLGRTLIRRYLAPGSGFSRVISLARDEVKAARLVAAFPDPKLRAFIGDIRDRDRLRIAFHGVDLVIHAAALKRVMESVYSPSELIQTNIIGTLNVIQVAVEAGVRRVIVVSSDKAAGGAVNLYGMTKGCAEVYAVQSNSYAIPRGTRVSAIRYGNVLGSRGSVLHTFRSQAQFGSISITDSRMTRFWLTLDEAAAWIDLLRQNMIGGEILVPALSAAPVIALAQAVAEEQGATVRLVETGLRPGGEKLHESLLSEEELTRTVEVHGGEEGEAPWVDYFLVSPSYYPWTSVQPWGGLPRTQVTQYRSDQAPRISPQRLLAMVKQAPDDVDLWA
jgi:UDP-N-acetylglucosamine 4,6-dehydratase